MGIGLNRTRLTVILTLFILGLPFIGRALDTSWNTQITATVGGCQFDVERCGSAGTYVFLNPNITVYYHATIVDNDTGLVVQPGATLPIGKSITLKFTPHAYNDVYWFGSGGLYDSPYGNWDTTAVSCTDNYFVRQDRGGAGFGRIYASFNVASPSKSIEGINSALSCGAPDAMGSRVCTTVAAGSVPLSFSFSETSGGFYGAINNVDRSNEDSKLDTGARCLRNSHPMLIKRINMQYPGHGGSVTGVDQANYLNRFWQSGAASTRSVAVGARTIAYPITIEADAEGEAAPRITSVSAVNSCVVGAQTRVSMNATDADGDQVRYLIDWDATADSPADADSIPDNDTDQVFPSSGGYVDQGVPRVVSHIFAQGGEKRIAIRAEDSTGKISSISTYTFTCGDEASVGLDGYNYDLILTGDDGIIEEPILRLNARPSVVRKGSSTRVFWSAENVDSCTVVGSNGDGPWGGVDSAVDGEPSGAITNTVTYTLSCIDLRGNTQTRTANVTVAATFNEI